MSFPNRYFTLSPYCTLKHLEEPYLYDIERDELYELSWDAFHFLILCALGESPEIKKEEEPFIEYCLSENLIKTSEVPVKRELKIHPSPLPSLRYLELQITDRCNLRCRHCYLGESHHQDLPFEKIKQILQEFEEIQGLRLLISGGEPCLYPHFWELNEIIRDYEFRSILLSNGTLITREVARRLKVHEVQLSLDGMEEGHESLRGKGTFQKVIQAIDNLKEASVRVSIATMIHQKNLKEFDELSNLIKTKEIEEWNVDFPCISGRLKENSELWVKPEETALYLRYGYGGGFHDSEKNTTCGAHLCAIIPNGKICKCGLFSDEPIGTIEEGLRACWERMPRILLTELTCDCPQLDECRGGCRFRAKFFGTLYDPDPYQCYFRGIKKGGE
ncbi:MAG: radical SAM protein [Thermodesulfobacteriota bacterium]